MAYIKTEWKDRIVEYPNRYTDQNGVVHILSPSPGIITEEGTPITAVDMNKLEEGVRLGQLASGTDLSATILGFTNVDAVIKEIVKRITYSNLTLFKINTTDATSGVPVVGYNFKIAGSSTTTYTSDSSGYKYVLLPYGSYTLTFLDTVIGFDVTAQTFSSVSGESYNEIPAIFKRSAVKKYTMANTATYKKAPYITQIDVFLVGGGGTGGGSGATSNWNGSGGGGGYTRTQLGINVSAYTEFTPTIGAGGSGWEVGGGQTSFLGYTANGGSSGANSSSGGTATGGSGGSGGGGANTTTSAGGAGGSDGMAGSGTATSAGGAGQGTTTREFGEAGGTLYSGGGGGAEGGVGGAGGGGTGANSAGTSGGSATFYGGGGGGAAGGTSGSRNGGNGYNGCVVIRWA